MRCRVFTLGVFNVMALAYFTGAFPFLMPYYYTLKVPLLLGYRFFTYCPHKFGYFLIDFCYFANYALVAYLWVFPRSPELFTVVFCLAHGPLAWAVFLFRNSLVFHSADKVTSAFIHISPMLVTFGLRWGGRPALADALVGGEGGPSQWAVCRGAAYVPAAGPHASSCGSYVWAFLAPLGAYLCWFALYSLVVRVLLPPPEGHATSFSYVTSSGPMRRLRGMKNGYLVYVAINCAVTAVMLAPTVLFMHSFWANMLFVAFVILGAVWNGAAVTPYHTPYNITHWRV
jgi:hypothetical protein